MPIGATGFPPVIPGLTGGVGSAPDAISPAEKVSMLMGMRPQRPDTTTEKMAQIIQLMREVSKDDPRIGGLVSDALRMLVEGPQGLRPGGPSSTPVGGPAQSPGGLSSPIGGATATPA